MPLCILKIRIIGHTVHMLYKCLLGGWGSNISVVHFSATSWPILIKPSIKVGTVRGFIDPENQDDCSHTTESRQKNNILCVCPSVCLFYFKCLFLSNRWPYFNQSWQAVGYTICKCKSKEIRAIEVHRTKLFSLDQGCSFVCVSHFERSLTPFSHQPLGQFRPNLPGT